MPRKFQRTIEDFVCGRCGAAVIGNGYTNHCPVCLWSRHVDVNPGDRAESCYGLMEPMGVEGKAGEWRIVHVCVTCGARRVNRVVENDSREALIALSAKR